jgi:ABC-type uncharacterized transport system auxiliary subunit
MKTPFAAALLLAVIAAPFAPGCGLLSSANESGNARFFSLERTPSPVVATAPGGPLRLRLGRITGSPHLEERMVYRDSVNEVGYHREVRWIEPPEMFLKRQLASALFEERGVQRVVGGAGATLVVKLTVFDEIRYPRHLARAQVVARLHDERVVLWEETITVERQIAWAEDGDLAIVAVAAFGEALRDVVDRVADDVLRVLGEHR